MMMQSGYAEQSVQVCHLIGCFMRKVKNRGLKMQKTIDLTEAGKLTDDHDKAFIRSAATLNSVNKDSSTGILTSCTTG